MGHLEPEIEPGRDTRELERLRKAEYRERRRVDELDVGKSWKGLYGEEREQAIRDHFGYAKSETRTQLEREETAERITRKLESYLTGAYV